MKPIQMMLAGLAVAAVLAGLFYLLSEGRAPRVEGQITAVRTLGMDQDSSVAIVDFVAKNNSEITMQVGDRKISVIDSEGNELQGRTVGAPDLKRLFEYFPALGSMRNPPLIPRIKLAPGDPINGMAAARFEIPKHELDARQSITLVILDVDGSVSELIRESEPLEEEEN